MILADTSVLVDFFKGVQNQGVAKLQAALSQQLRVGITSGIFQELLQGAKSEKEFNLLHRYLETQHFYHPLHPVESYAEAARIFMNCRRKGITVRSTSDCLIARIAIENNLLLLHSDADFTAMANVVALKFF